VFGSATVYITCTPCLLAEIINKTKMSISSFYSGRSNLRVPTFGGKNRLNPPHVYWKRVDPVYWIAIVHQEKSNRLKLHESSDRQNAPPRPSLALSIPLPLFLSLSLSRSLALSFIFSLYFSVYLFICLFLFSLYCLFSSLFFLVSTVYLVLSFS
jgi:hypothetical protein